MAATKIMLLILLSFMTFSCSPRDVRISTTPTDLEILEQIASGDTIDISQGRLPNCDLSRSAYSYLELSDSESLPGIFNGEVQWVTGIGVRQCFEIGEAVNLRLSKDKPLGEVVVNRIILVHFDHLSETHAKGTGMNLEELKERLLEKYGSKVDNEPIALIDITYIEGSYPAAAEYLDWN